MNRARLKAKAALAAASAAAANTSNSISSMPNSNSPSNEKDEIPIKPPIKAKNKQESELFENGVYGTVKEEYLKQPFKNPEAAYKEAMNLLSQEDW